MKKPRLSFWQIWNMSFGFLGIQFGWGLQMANMSAIYEYLGAQPDQIPILWLAAPLTGLIVQPHHRACERPHVEPAGAAAALFSDGRDPEFAGADPDAAIRRLCGWRRGCCGFWTRRINISMEPFRAFVADMLPEEQRTRGFAMQSLFIGLGAVVASALPWLLTNVFGVAGGARRTAFRCRCGSRSTSARRRSSARCCGPSSTTQRVSAGGSGSVPQDEGREARHRGERAGDSGSRSRRCRRPCASWRWVQIRHLAGPVLHVAVLPGGGGAQRVRRARSAESPLYTEGVEWGGILLRDVFGGVFCVLVRAAGDGRHGWAAKLRTALCLLCGAAGLMSVAVIHNKWLLLLSMVGVGIAWASTLSMPYAILAGSLPPEKTGIYMGIFNFFIVTPEIVASLVFGWVMLHLLDNNRLLAVEAGGVFFVLAALLMQRVRDVGMAPAAVNASTTSAAGAGV